MKKLFVCSLLAAAVALSGTMFADEVAPKKAHKRGHEFTGEITAVDAKACTLTVKHVKAEGEPKTFKVPADCKIVVAPDKENATLADLKVGDKVHVMYMEDAGVLTAKKIGPVPPVKKEGVKKEAPAPAAAPVTK